MLTTVPAGSVRVDFGGYGDPTDRDPEAVARDVRLGKVTPETALEAYGVDPSVLPDDTAGDADE